MVATSSTLIALSVAYVFYSLFLSLILIAKSYSLAGMAIFKDVIIVLECLILPSKVKIKS